VQPLPRVQGDPQFGRSSVEPEAAQPEEANSERVCSKCNAPVAYDNGMVTYSCLCKDRGFIWRSMTAQPDGELVDKMCREYYPHNIWGQLSRIEQGECRRNMTAALAAVRRAIEAQAREGYVPIEDVEKVFVRIPRASLRGRGSDERRKSSQKD